MTGENFIARWSRRKRESAAGDDFALAETPREPSTSIPAGPDREPAAKEEMDVADLPPIDSIDAATDISVFLRKGIPDEVRHAALRRAWSSDPAIRDFVGLAENAWDFNDPNAMPGFGPLDYSVEQVKALVGRIIGGAVREAETVAGEPQRSADSGPPFATRPRDEAAPLTVSEQAEPQDLFIASDNAMAGLAAAQSNKEGQGTVEDVRVPHRKHGGALPS